MKKNSRPLVIIGRAEVVKFPEISEQEVHARIDTGANTSAVWASEVELKDGVLSACFFSKGHPAYTGKKVTFHEYSETIVASSSGHAEHRFKVKVLVNIAGRKIRARFTLADRSSQAYPVLIGRNVLRGKFLVDVKRGTPLTVAEKARSQQLQSKLTERGEV